MSKAKAVVVFVILGIFILMFALFTVPLNGQDSFEIAGTTYDFYWISKAISLGLDLKGGVYAVFEADLADVADADAAMDGAMSNLSTLLASKGYTEATVTKQGSNKIRVEVPDITDTQSLLELIGNPATLEIKDSNDKLWIVGDKHITNAYATLYEGVYAIALEFNAAGTEAFAKATAENLNKTLSIYIDGTEVVSPTVNSEITNGQAVISGNYTYETANDMATKIRAGALGVKLSYSQSETISPTLGDSALSTGIIAGIIGTALIIVFLILIYKGLGLCSSIALIFYIELLLFFLAVVPWVQLTLPGIAGVILSIGMAVDANIVIFERIKDEKYKGRGVISAVRSGFKDALAPIIDANITTIIGAVIMIIFGAAAIQSFAIVLLIGILLSMFSSLVITRLVINSFLAFNPDGERFYGLEFKLSNTNTDKSKPKLSAEEEV